MHYDNISINMYIYTIFLCHLFVTKIFFLLFFYIFNHTVCNVSKFNYSFAYVQFVLRSLISFIKWKIFVYVYIYIFFLTMYFTLLFLQVSNHRKTILYTSIESIFSMLKFIVQLYLNEQNLFIVKHNKELFLFFFYISLYLHIISN